MKGQSQRVAKMGRKKWVAKNVATLAKSVESLANNTFIAFLTLDPPSRTVATKKHSLADDLFVSCERRT